MEQVPIIGPGTDKLAAGDTDDAAGAGDACCAGAPTDATGARDTGGGEEGVEAAIVVGDEVDARADELGDSAPST